MNPSRTLIVLFVGVSFAVAGASVSFADEPVAATGHRDAAESADAHNAKGGDGATGHQAKGPAILTGDLGNVFWTSVIFVVLLLVLGTTAWKPILTALQNREKFITESIAAAKRERMESERLMREYAEKMNKAREEATAIVEEGRRDAEALRRKIHEDAKKESAEMIVRAQREIKIAKDTAVADLYQQVVEVATNLAGRITRKQMNAADHRGLLDESLAELGKLKN